MLAVFPTLEILHDLPGEYFANSREAALLPDGRLLYTAHGGGRLPAAAVPGDPAYQGRMAALERAAGRREARLSDPELSGKLFGERPRLSPSQIESYQNCPFQYFCRYGLGAKERRPAEVDVLQYGTLMHFLFERVFRCPAEERAAWGDQELEERIWELIQEYAQENLGGLELLRGQERYRLERLARSAGKLIHHVEEELSQSRFTPEGFELGVGRQLPPLKVRTQSGALVTVGGTIDRGGRVPQPRGEGVRPGHRLQDGEQGVPALRRALRAEHADAGVPGCPGGGGGRPARRGCCTSPRRSPRCRWTGGAGAPGG